MEHQWFCGGKDPCACMDSWKEAELEKGLAAKVKAEEWARWWMRRIESGETYPRIMGEADAAEIDRRLGTAIDNIPHYPDLDLYGEMLKPAIEAAIGADEGQSPACVHEWAFLRTRSEDVCLDIQGRPHAPLLGLEQTSLDVDVFFCRRCLEYRTKGG